MLGTEVIGDQPWRGLQEEVENLKELDSKELSSSSVSLGNKRSKPRKKMGSQTSIKAYTSPKEQLKSSKNPAESLPITQNVSNSPLNLDNNEANSQCNVGNMIDRLQHLNIEESMQNDITVIPNVDSHFCHVSSTGTEATNEANLVNNNGGKFDSKNTCASNPNETNDLKKTHSKKKSSTSQLERLNMLLSKKKNVLSKMADIQDVIIPTKESLNNSTKFTSSKTGSCSKDSDSSILNKDVAQPIMACDLNSVSASSTLKLECNESAQRKSKSMDKTKDYDHCQLSPLELIATRLKPWMTENTKQYLKASSSSKAYPAGMNSHSFSNPAVQQGYLDLCQRLDLQEKGLEAPLEELTISDDGKVDRDKSKNMRTLPDYVALKEESEKFGLKVIEFITGKNVVKQQERIKAEV